ncbi:uncharacterized protein LOC113520320 isoform X1 [Galleria mellonella]|uniref:Uncharacterized protein LOC113520320 isoform X1 n=1 Tax=Galleria mellonella TaxID=7137 RepID=A0A6J1X5E7_GALME|nr:uncharacterized protein LOC113520320 isoform X1 [Galleria mellonella]XP_052754098.1 uncharacterized protein LOC113520320 isoform X1 [Galleria mellonella]XP_052754099.1 uncharacterized protein LOC113520320 isoform X1 [Galleria mellonella]
MKTSMYLVAVCAALVAVYAAPAPNPEPNPDPAPQPNPAPSPADDRPEIIEIIAPAASAQETLATLNLGAPGSDLSERNKRTIGILRQLFPTLTQIIEQKVQQITSMVLQTFGPVVLRAFLGGNRNGGGNKGGGGGSVELDDDDDDDEDDVTPVSSTTEATSTTAADAAKLRRKRALFFLPNAIAEENQLLSGAESQQAEVRVAFGEGQEGQDQQVAASEDQQTAAQTNSASIDEITLDDADSSEENRNKRFLSGGGQTPSAGGSGNFLFDIVRLVSGTFASSSADPGAPADGDDASAGKGDNLTEGVPGPITRLFIIANRGIANLIQDLILRIAQTSERIVNFKARLITSII